MLKGITNVFKRRKLKLTSKAISVEAVKKKKWGSNLTTLLITSTLVCDNLDILDQDTFVEGKRNKIIDSYFTDFSSMYSWLSEVSSILNSFAFEGMSQLPDNQSYLNLVNKNEIMLHDFMQHNNMYINIDEKYRKISRLLKSIEDSLEHISANSRGYLDMRLANGFNTIIVINEQILEVMING